MKQEFAKKIDVLLIRLLDIFDEHGRGSIQSMRIAIDRALEDAEQTLASDRNWEYAKFAIVSWIDHEATKLDEHWQYETLERKYFPTSDAHTEYFRQAEEATLDARYDALEIFYLCFLFGFRGIYDPSKRSDHDKPANLPKYDFDWQSEMANRIKGASLSEGVDWQKTMPKEKKVDELVGRSTFTNGCLFFSFSFLLLATSLIFLAVKVFRIL